MENYHCHILIHWYYCFAKMGLSLKTVNKCNSLFGSSLHPQNLENIKLKGDAM